MDSVREAEETLDIGICPIYNRVYECYCTHCHCMICPNALMFGSCRGHSVISIEEGVKDIRSRINLSAKEGVLKFDKTENVLLDIRHVKLSLEENQEQILKQIESNFDDLISTLKNRKKHFLAEMKDHFQKQMQIIEDTENQWEQKQELSQKILQLQTSKDDIKLVEEAKIIVEGLEKLAQPLEYKELKLIEGVRPEGKFGKTVLGFNELKETLKSFMQKGGQTVTKLKC